IPNGTEDIGGSVVPEEVIEEEQGMGSLTNTPIALMLRIVDRNNANCVVVRCVIL
ncbi:hypothetical protein Tco_0055743, partial [Tanacetum coccineum]